MGTVELSFDKLKMQSGTVILTPKNGPKKKRITMVKLNRFGPSFISTTHSVRFLVNYRLRRNIALLIVIVFTIIYDGSWLEAAMTATYDPLYVCQCLFLTYFLT